MRNRFQITKYCHDFLKEYVKEGDRCIDATAGNGNDTEFLCRLVGDRGAVYAFDIQEKALAHTKRRLVNAGLEDRAVLIEDGHENMQEYVKGEVAAIVFNFGYLPGGDHKIATKPDTSLRAVQQALALLKPEGIMSLCIYSGKDTGYEEKKAVLDYLKELDPKKWLVLVHSYYNRRNDPPLPVFVIRLPEVKELCYNE